MSYRPIGWSDHEPIYTAKLQQMVDNDQYLYENTPRVRYNAYNIQRDTTLRIASGVVYMPTGAAIVNKQVYFGSFFTAGCAPVVVATPNTNGEARIIVSVQGLSQITPGHEGFKIIAAINSATITKQFLVHWMAVGF